MPCEPHGNRGFGGAEKFGDFCFLALRQGDSRVVTLWSCAWRKLSPKHLSQPTPAVTKMKEHSYRVVRIGPEFRVDLDEGEGGCREDPSPIP